MRGPLSPQGINQQAVNHTNTTTLEDIPPALIPLVDYDDYDDVPDLEPRAHLYKKNQPVGDTLTTPKDPSFTRFYIQNPDGFNLSPMGSFQTALDHLKSMDVDHAMLPEIKLDTGKSSVRSKIHAHCRNVFGLGETRVTMASSPIQYESINKPGGVMSVTIGRLKGRICDSGSDKYGRWTYTSFSGKNDTIITWITTYQVCKENAKKAGPTKTITQQLACLTKDGRLQPERVRHHHSADLTRFVKERQAQGDKVCVAGDFNEVIGEDSGGLTKLCSDCGLKDIIFEKHGATQFSTYIKGRRVLDYILIDPTLEDTTEACGYEPFNIRIMGDHRGAFLDVHTASFFGSDTRPFQRMENRDVRSKKTHQLIPYFQVLTDQLAEHKWNAKIDELEQCIQTSTPNDNLAATLDQQRIQAAKYAGSRLPKFKPAPYSPELARMSNIDSILTLAIQQFDHNVDQSEQIEARKRQLSLPFTIPSTLAACWTLRKEHRKVMQAAIKDELKTGNSRTHHQDELIGKYTDAGDKDAARIIKRIKRAEQMARVWQKCAHARGKTKGGGLAHLLVPTVPGTNPKTCTEWKRIDDPEEINLAIQARLQEHFGQSKDCAWTSPPLDVTMDFEGTCAKAEAILDGTFDTTDLDLDPATRWVIENLARIAEPIAVDPVLTAEEFEGKVKAWDERTSTSPASNIHLGHAKMYFAKHHFDPESPQARLLEKQRNQVLRGHLVCLNYAIKFGYIFDRWKTIVNAILEKDPGTPKIHRLRIIMLLEYDLNLLFCVKWRALLHHVCDNKLINRSCFGSMPGKNSLDPVFIKEMEYEISRLTRKHLLNGDKDATACYDRIPCFLANVSSRKYGQNSAICVVQGRTMAQAKYHLKTQLGISETHISHCRLLPWFGTGQGTGNSPMYWLLISSTLFDIYENKAKGAKYISPDGSLEMDLYILGFVDDTNNRTNNFTADPQPPVTELIQDASHDSQLWHDLLAAVNQALNLSKCKYHLIHYAFKDSGEPSMIIDAAPPADLQVVDKAGDPVSITHVPSDSAIRYLGCDKAPASQRDQQATLQKQCNDYAKVINCSHLTRRDTYTFYEGIYRLSVGYPLPVCYFTLEQLDKIQRQVHSAMISHCGYNRSTAKPVIFGPRSMGGAGFFHLYDLQGYGQITMFLKYWRTPQTHQGKIIRIVLAWAQFCAGTSRPILIDTHSKLPHLESCWLSSMRKYLDDIKGTIEVDDPMIPKLQRINDIHIMDNVPSHFKGASIRRINYCRLYLNAVTVSDLSNAAGTHLDPGMYSGNTTETTSTSKWQRVNQQKPGEASWKIWRQYCNTLLLHKPTKELLQPLGNWTVQPAQLRRSWPFWHDQPTDTLFHVTSDNITAHSRLTTDFDQDVSIQPTTMPDTAVPVDIVCHPQTWSLPHQVSHFEPVAVPPQPATFHEYVTHLPSWEQELLSGLKLHGNVYATLQSQPLIGASDGSAKSVQASFGWIISTTTGQRLVQCNGPAFGYKPASYRAEGYGVLSMSRFIHHLREFKGITVNINYLCDNESMVGKSNLKPDLEDISPNSTLISDWDVLVEIWTTLSPLGEDRPNVTHIKSHQDDETTYEELPLPAQLNVQADKLADKYITDNPDKDYSKVPLLPTSGVQLHLPGGHVTYKLKRELRLARTTAPLKKHFMKRFLWHTTTFDDINWEAHRRGINRNTKIHTILVKHFNRILPLGGHVHKYDPKYPQNCPSCPEPDEIAAHLYQCPSRQAWRSQFLQGLRKTLDAINTAPDLAVLLLAGLEIYLHSDLPDVLTVPPSVRHIATAQEVIGWDHLLRGRLSVQWQHHQQAFLGDKSDSKTNGLTWTTDIIDYIFKQFKILWDQRNGDRHGVDRVTQAQAKARQAIRELHLLYAKKDLLHIDHQWILAPPIEQRLHWTGPVMRAWINSFKPIIEANYTDGEFTID